MKSHELAAQKGYSLIEFERFLSQNPANLQIKRNLVGAVTFDDGYASTVAREFEAWLNEQEMERKKKAEQEEQQRIEEIELKKSLASMLITSGFTFDGYTIKKYSGYISGDDVIQIPRGREGIFASATNVGDALSKALVQMRRNALAELKEAAYDLGCNAVIGVDFDYLTLEPETVNSNGGTLYLPYVCLLYTSDAADEYITV